LAWRTAVLVGFAGAALGTANAAAPPASLLFPAARGSSALPGVSIPLGAQSPFSPRDATQSFHTEFGGVTRIARDFAFANKIAPADFDGDGAVDVAIDDRSPAAIYVYLNPGVTGGSWTQVPVATGLTDTYDLVAGDFDGDGDVDLLSAENDNNIVWYENAAGDGTVWLAHTITTGASGIRFLAAADIDGDGDLDFAAALQGAGVVAWYENAAGNGSVWTLHVMSTAFSSPSGMAAADLDADGDMDLVGTQNTAYAATSEVFWLENTDGKGTEWAAHRIAPPDSIIWPRGVAVGDLDGDGDLDVASASRNDDMVAWYESNGASPPDFTMHVLVNNPGWSAPAQAGQCTTCTPGCGFADGAIVVLLADLDLDGDLDIVAVAAHSDRIFWLENANGDGSVWRTHNLVNPGNPRDAALADVDGDGDLDVLYVNKSEPDSPTEPLAIPGKGAYWVANVLLPGPPPPFTGICSDGVDNDGDCLIDFPADPGCFSASSNTESPQCNDNLDNDGDGAIDYAGGPNGELPDPQCVGVPWSNREAPPACGLGGELALLVPLVFAFRRAAWGRRAPGSRRRGG
jgi:hypothetical protein